MSRWKIKSVVVLALVGLLFPLLARADWTLTFQPEVLQSYLPATPVKVMVVGIGDSTLDPQGAVDVLKKGFRACAQVTGVIEDPRWDGLREVDDKTIVSRSAGDTTGLVAVMRLFAGTESNVFAVVALYEPSGAVYSAFVAEEGQSVPPRLLANVLTNGVSNETARTVSALLDSQQTVDTGAQDVYDRSKIWFQEDGQSAPSKVALENRIARSPLEGGRGRLLSWTEFYKKIGREDLAQQYQSGLNVKTACYATSGALVVGSLAYMLIRGASSGLAVPLGLMSLSLVSTTVGLLYNPQPVGSLEVRVMANDYNLRLRNRLGLDSNSPTRNMSQQIPSLSLIPTFGKQGAGLLWNVNF